MKRSHARRIRRQPLLAPLLLTSLVAVAQEQPAAPVAAASPKAAADEERQAKGGEVSQLEAVVVTSQKRSQLLQDVPITVNVMGAKLIEDARIMQIVDVANRTPGLNFDSFPATQPRPAVRGIGSSDRGAAGDPSTAVFIDEVYYGRPAAVAFDAFDVERIEVLKGPQGTLWGKNVVGGAIHVVNEKPLLHETYGRVALTAGNHGRLDGAGFFNVELGEETALRLSLSSRHRDGFAYNTYLNTRVDDEDTTSARLQLLTQRDRLTLLFSGDLTRDRGTGSARRTVGIDPTSSTRSLWANAIDPNPETTRNDIEGHQDRDSKGLRVNVDYRADDFTFSSISSYRWLDYDALEDADGGNPTTNRLNARGLQVESTRFWSQELRIAAPEKSAVNWVAGAYFYGSHTRRTDGLIVDRPPAPSGSFNALDQFDQHAVTRSMALFGDVTVPVSPSVNLFGGVRVSRDQKDYDVTTANSTAFLRSAGAYTVAASKSWSKPTFRAGVDFKASKELLLYGSVANGFKSGGFQDTPTTAASAATPFGPEKATNYEVGAKASLLGGRLFVNASAYWTDYTDLQVRSTVNNTSITENAGSARIKGVEVSVEARPTRAFSVMATYALTQARFIELIDRGVDYSGNYLTRNPRQKVTLSPSYRFSPAPGYQLTTAVDYAYESRIYDDISNDPNTIRPAKQLVDARLVIDTPCNWSVTLWGKNLGNEVYRTHQFYLLGGQFATYGAPRTYGVTGVWKF